MRKTRVKGYAVEYKKERDYILFLFEREVFKLRPETDMRKLLLNLRIKESTEKFVGKRESVKSYLTFWGHLK